MFDRVLVVDWSANSAPKRGADSIWVAELHVGDLDRGVHAWNPSTRHAAAELLIDRLEAVPRSRTLIGVDFSIGFPAGFAAALGLVGVPWSSTWSRLVEWIDDDGRNRNNRFAVAADLNACISGSAAPFWGCPPSASAPTLTSTKPVEDESLPEWRVTEEALRAAGHRPFSSWQLFGAGSVGGQALLGIPVLERLRRSRPAVEVWPLTTGLGKVELEPGGVLIAEVWPSMYDVPDVGEGPKDRRQVAAVADALVAAIGAGELGAWFSPSCPPHRRRDVVEEEGWVLGAGIGSGRR